MQTTEINGFVIDEFNSHKLDEGNKQGICPVCSPDRKPKNQKAKCASYDWERGLGTCHKSISGGKYHRNRKIFNEKGRRNWEGSRVISYSRG